MRGGGVRLAGVVVLLLAGGLGLAAPSSAKERAPVVRLDLDDAVQPLSASYVVDGIHLAERSRARAVLLRIDTPGGLDHSMRRIVGAVLSSTVPVVCWVGPDGARAASAGTFILLACHWATMAPGTNVGAAHPVGLSGNVLSEKITNDAAAFIRSIAEERGRNAGWAERAVRDSVSASARESVALNVVDAIAASPDAALKAAAGKKVSVDGRTLSLETWPATVRTDQMPVGRSLIGALVDPNLAFLLFVLGLAGLVFEVMHPGFRVPGILGLLALVVALVMFEMLPVTVAGLILLVAGVAFFVAELHVTGHGVAGGAGVAAVVAGGLLLYDPHALVRVSRGLVVGVAAGSALFFLVVVRGALRARRVPSPTPRTLLGVEGVATTDLSPDGTVRVRGELWTAEAAGEPVSRGSRVVVVEEEGLRLRVMGV